MSSGSAGQWIGTIVGAVVGYFLPGVGWAIGAAIPGRCGAIVRRAAK